MKKFNLYKTVPDAQLEKHCDFKRFSKKYKIDWGLVEILHKFADPLYVFL